MSAPALSIVDVQAFLKAKYGQVEDLERLAGGYWSAAYTFKATDRELVARFGADRSWYEADQAATVFATPELPVPQMIEVGEGLGGAFAVSVRHHGVCLEDIDPEQSQTAGPMLGRLLDALYLVPKSVDLAVGWHWKSPPRDVTWRKWLVESLVDNPGRHVHGWRTKLAADPGLDRLFRACEARITNLVDACPERRDLVHADLLHGNVLVTTDARKVTAVFSWKCSLRGDFIYEHSLVQFWRLHRHRRRGPVGTHADLGRDPGRRARPRRFRDRHHCYELQIGATHLAWNIWVGNDAALTETARMLSAVLEQGPLAATLPAPVRGQQSRGRLP